MFDRSSYHNRQPVIANRIRGSLSSLNSSTYDEIAPKIEYWIEFVLAERSMTAGDLAERVSTLAWCECSRSDVSRFLKEFRDAPHRSEQARSFVDGLCDHVLLWFAVASAENLPANTVSGEVQMSGGIGFICAASFVGHLIECELLAHDLVRRRLIKPLIAHHYANERDTAGSANANAIYQLFVIAGNTLLQGLLEPEDVQVCFGTLDTRPDYPIQGLPRFDGARVNVR